MLTACRRLACVGLLALSSGCAICQNCDDESYAAYGGAWERNDRCNGRVGSAFTPEAGTRVLPPEVVWQAAQGRDAAAWAHAWLHGEALPAGPVPKLRL